MNADVVTARSSKEKARDARLLQHVLHPLEEAGVKPIDSHNARYGIPVIGRGTADVRLHFFSRRPDVATSAGHPEK
jgi:hypothetical protein